MARTKDHFTAAIIGVGAAEHSSAKGGGHQAGYMHAAMYKRHPSVRLVAAADPNPTNLAAFERKFGVHQAFADHRQMLRKVQPDVVSIATYVGLHRRMIEDCAKAGVRGIVCEKPFLESPADLEAVRRVAEKTGLKLVVAHVRRFCPGFIRARRLYQEGEVGRPMLCFAGIEGWDLSEWGSHWLDIFRFFHNDAPIRWVMGQARVRQLRGYGHAMEDHAIAYFEFETGAKAFLDGGVGFAGEGLHMELVGAEGVIHIHGHDANRLVIENGRGRSEETFRTDWNRLWDETLGELLRQMQTPSRSPLGLDNMLKTAELNLAAYISALRGDRVDLPLEDDLAEWPLESLARRTTSAPGTTRTAPPRTASRRPRQAR